MEPPLLQPDIVQPSYVALGLAPCSWTSRQPISISSTSSHSQSLHPYQDVRHDNNKRKVGNIASAYHFQVSGKEMGDDDVVVENKGLDWCGRGDSYVEFEKGEPLPLPKERFLGHGVYGPVYAIECQGGQLVAWKKIYCRRGISQAEKREIVVLKRLKPYAYNPTGGQLRAETLPRPSPLACGNYRSGNLSGWSRRLYNTSSQV